MKALRRTLALGIAMLMAAPAYAALRPQIAIPLRAAEQALSAHRYAAALGDVAKAEAVSGKTAEESFTILQIRAAIDAARGDHAAAAADYAGLLASGQLSGPRLTVVAEAEASSYYAAGDYAHAAGVIKTHLSRDPRYHQLLLQSYFKLNECAPLSQAVGPHGSLTDLQMVAYCYATTRDNDGYVRALSLMVQAYPTQANWTQLLGVLRTRPVYADRLALDFFRLQQAAGVPATEPAYMLATQEALQAGLNNEALAIITHGFASGVMGAGADLDRQKRLMALVKKRVADQGAGQAAAVAQARKSHDEQALFYIGWNSVEGGDKAGLRLMAEAIRSGRLSQPAQAELEMGIAFKEAGEPAKAQAMWRAIDSHDDAGTLAKLWLDVQ
ncbi:unnamed protein product [Acidocella sp. C78]|uniref:hypothetical protein n=1 Tax=Acidocella sp. C78 TaxID=1671486 RepID=UPI00191BA758|nr:hypothetical protein [Acidocella sp. C78]CAG4913034.1 unnamed protein product [Acidocella sp. C78]